MSRFAPNSESWFDRMEDPSAHTYRRSEADVAASAAATDAEFEAAWAAAGLNDEATPASDPAPIDPEARSGFEQQGLNDEQLGELARDLASSEARQLPESGASRFIPISLAPPEPPEPQVPLRRPPLGKYRRMVDNWKADKAAVKVSEDERRARIKEIRDARKRELTKERRRQEDKRYQQEKRNEIAAAADAAGVAAGQTYQRRTFLGHKTEEERVEHRRMMGRLKKHKQRSGSKNPEAGPA